MGAEPKPAILRVLRTTGPVVRRLRAHSPTLAKKASHLIRAGAQNPKAGDTVQRVSKTTRSVAGRATPDISHNAQIRSSDQGTTTRISTQRTVPANMSGQIAPCATCPFSPGPIELWRPNFSFGHLHKVRLQRMITTDVSTFVEVNGTKPQLVSTATATQIRNLSESAASFFKNSK